MKTVLDVGIGQVLLPVIGWTLLLLVLALVAGALVLRACRRRLAAAGRPTGRATAILALVHLLLVPLLAGYLGVSFALQRSVAKVLRSTTDRLVDKAIDRGSAALRRELHVEADETPIDLEALRARSRERVARAGGGGGVLPAARIGHPLVLPFVLPALLPDLLDVAWWWGVDQAVGLAAKESSRLTWAELEKLVRPRLAGEGKKLFGKLSDPFASGARNALLILLALVALADVGSILVVRRLARAARGGSAGAAPPAPPARTTAG